MKYSELKHWKKQILEESVDKVKKDLTSYELEVYRNGLWNGMNEIISTLRLQNLLPEIDFNN